MNILQLLYVVVALWVCQTSNWNEMVFACRQFFCVFVRFHSLPCSCRYICTQKSDMKPSQTIFLPSIFKTIHFLCFVMLDLMITSTNPNTKPNQPFSTITYSIYIIHTQHTHTHIISMYNITQRAFDVFFFSRNWYILHSVTWIWMKAAGKKNNQKKLGHQYTNYKNVKHCHTFSHRKTTNRNKKPIHSWIVFQHQQKAKKHISTVQKQQRYHDTRHLHPNE